MPVCPEGRSTNASLGPVLLVCGLVLALLIGAAVWPTPVGATAGPGASSTAEAAADTDASQQNHSDQATRGAKAYAFSCAVCHGDTGQGFQEAVAAFPEDHRYCAACHQPQNSPTMPGSQVGLSTMAFSIGDPPPLADAGRLRRFGTAAGLYHYLRAAMPRWAPGRLDDQTYLDLTAQLLRMTGFLPDAQTLEAADLDGFRLE